MGDFESLFRPPRFDIAEADRDCGAELPVSVDGRLLLTGSLEAGESRPERNLVAERGLEGSSRGIDRVLRFGMLGAEDGV